MCAQGGALQGNANLSITNFGDILWKKLQHFSKIILIHQRYR